MRSNTSSQSTLTLHASTPGRGVPPHKPAPLHSTKSIPPPSQSLFTLILTLLLFIASNTSLFSQSNQSKFKQFKSLSPPVRAWVITHLRSAPKVLRISSRALALTDSMRSSPELDGDFNGGTLDAFRHGIWMAMLVQEIPDKRAARLGEAYERGNYRDFKRGKLEEGQLSDATSSEMDLFNNQKGREVGRDFGWQGGELPLILAVLQGIRRGDFVVISKDRLGISLDTNGNPIDLTQRNGEWQTHRSLVPSNTARK